MSGGKKKLIWAVVALVLMVLTIRTVLNMSGELTLSGLLETLRQGNPWFLAASLVSMVAYIVVEGEALLLILRSFGYRRTHLEGFLYSSGDVYFSAITPSATGGQPASAYFMMRNGIPGAVVTVTLLVNLIAYTLATMTVGLIALVFWPGVFLALPLWPKVLVVVGFITQVGLTALFFGLLRHGELLYRLGAWFFRILAKLHIIRRLDKRLKKLRNTVEQYKLFADMTYGKRGMMAGVWALDVLQRACQISVAPLIHLTLGGTPNMAGHIWAGGAYAQIGANCIPLPGGMGVADYLLYHSFVQAVPHTDALRLELISRGVSFYLCMFLSGIVALLGFLLVRKKKQAPETDANK